MTTLLVIGCSDIFMRRVEPALQKIESCTLIDIASRSKKKSDLLGIPKLGRLFNDYQLAIDQTAAKWVYISTINSEHERLAHLAIAAGKNVIIDKPAALSYKGAEKLVAAAKAMNVRIIEAALFQCHTQMKVITAALRESPVSRIIASFIIPPMPTDNFRNHSDLGGGAVYDMGAYVFGLGRAIWKSEPQLILGATTNRNNDLILSFSVLLDYGQCRSLVGHFGFDAHYLNRAILTSTNQIIELEKIFTTPENCENELFIKRGSETHRLICKPSDSFEVFFREILEEQMDFSLAQRSLLANAKGVDRLKEIFQ